MLKRYHGTAVVEETLSKLFHERMDIVGAMELMSELQLGSMRSSQLLQGRSDNHRGLNGTCSFLLGAIKSCERGWKQDCYQNGVFWSA